MRVNARYIAGAAVAVALGASAAAQNSAGMNLMPLHNGVEGIFFFGIDATSTLTPGNTFNSGQVFPAIVDGTTSPDGLQNEYIWRTYPKTVMNHPGLNTMEISSLQESFWTDDWVGDGSAIWDLFLAGGAVGALPPFIQPTLDATAGILYGGLSGFPAVACPPAGQISGYEFVTAFGAGVVFTATGNTGYVYGTDGLAVAVADGTDASILCHGYIQPGGLTSTGAPCTLGNQSSMGALSDDESQNDYHGGGFNEFLGLNPHDTGNPWPGNEAPLFANFGMSNSLGWFEPVLQPRGDGGGGLGTELGLGTLNPSVGGGAATYGYHLASFKDIGKFGVVASSFATLPFALNIFGADIILNIGEPTVSATQKVGAIVKQDFSILDTLYLAATTNDNFNKGTFKSSVIPLPVNTPQLTINMQGVALRVVPSLLAEESNAVKVTFRP